MEMRKTKIVCTIGPASESEEMLKKLMLAGMNVARFNFSHGTHEEHREKLERVRKVREELKLPVATMMDTKGPEIRLRDFEGGQATIKQGELFSLTTEEILGDDKRAAITYKNLKNDVKVGEYLLADDGLIEFQIEDITDTDIVCRVITGGVLKNHKSINAPGVKLSMPYVNEVDREDIIFGTQMGYDLIAISFVRSKEDVEEIRQILRENGSDMKIISKIENMQGIENLDEIIEASDGIMVARGDMGVEIPFERIPHIQKDMIYKTIAQGKYVITATQMLDSMIRNPRPTRAEVTDVANAIIDGSSAVMLSGESAAGSYAEEAVKTMARIAVETERSEDYKKLVTFRDETVCETTDAIAVAAITVAENIGAEAIIAVTMSGHTARAIAKFNPNCPVVGGTVSQEVYYQLVPYRAILPLFIEREENIEELFENVVKKAKNTGYITEGNKVVLVAGLPLSQSGCTNTIRVIEV